MGWHVHCLGGLYNIWSTIVDAYILEGWVTADMIEQVYVERAIEGAKKTARELVEEAKKNDGCSVPYPLYRCDLRSLHRKVRK